MYFSGFLRRRFSEVMATGVQKEATPTGTTVGSGRVDFSFCQTVFFLVPGIFDPLRLGRPFCGILGSNEVGSKAMKKRAGRIKKRGRKH